MGRKDAGTISHIRLFYLGLSHAGIYANICFTNFRDSLPWCLLIRAICFLKSRGKTEEMLLEHQLRARCFNKEVLRNHCKHPSRPGPSILQPCPHSTDGKMDAQRRQCCGRSHIHEHQTWTWTWTQVLEASISLFQNPINLIPVPSSYSPEPPMALSWPLWCFAIWLHEGNHKLVEKRTAGLCILRLLFLEHSPAFAFFPSSVSTACQVSINTFSLRNRNQL